MSPQSGLAVLYLVQFIVNGVSMPSSIEHRWRALGVLTKNGAPNAAMKNWARYLLTGEETEEILGGILFILSWVYEEGGVSTAGVSEDLGITV